MARLSVQGTLLSCIERETPTRTTGRNPRPTESVYPNFELFFFFLHVFFLVSKRQGWLVIVMSIVTEAHSLLHPNL